MDGLGIRTIVDLRTAEERQSAPTLWRVPLGQVPTTIASDKHSMRQSFRAPVTHASAPRRTLSAFFAGAPDPHAPEDRKSTRMHSRHQCAYRMPASTWKKKKTSPTHARPHTPH